MPPAGALRPRWPYSGGTVGCLRCRDGPSAALCPTRAMRSEARAPCRVPDACRCNRRTPNDRANDGRAENRPFRSPSGALASTRKSRLACFFNSPCPIWAIGSLQAMQPVARSARHWAAVASLFHSVVRCDRPRADRTVMSSRRIRRAKMLSVARQNFFLEITDGLTRALGSVHHRPVRPWLDLGEDHPGRARSACAVAGAEVLAIHALDSLRRRGGDLDAQSRLESAENKRAARWRARNASFLRSQHFAIRSCAPASRCACFHGKLGRSLGERALPVAVEMQRKRSCCSKPP